MSYPERPDDTGDDELFFLNEPNEADPNFDAIDAPEALHAVPAVIDLGDFEVGHRPIELDDDEADTTGKKPRLDLSALFGAFDAGQKPKPKPAAESGEQTAEIARLRDELEKERNNVRRAQADLINNRRKAQQERERAVQEATNRIIKQLLPIIDDFERSLSAASGADSYDMLLAGVEAILRNFATLLSKQGVDPVPSVGMIFDTDLHEAVSLEETSEHPDEMILEELRKGYTQDGRLLRAALVKVAKNTPAADDSAKDLDDDSPEE